MSVFFFLLRFLGPFCNRKPTKLIRLLPVSTHTFFVSNQTFHHQFPEYHLWEDEYCPPSTTHLNTFKNKSTSSVSTQNTNHNIKTVLHTNGINKCASTIKNYFCSKDNANKLCAFKLNDLVQNNTISFIYLHTYIKLVMLQVSVINQLTDTVNDWTHMTMAKKSKLGFYVTGNWAHFLLTLDLQTFSNKTFDLVVLNVTGIVNIAHKENQWECQEYWNLLNMRLNTQIIFFGNEHKSQYIKMHFP